jgi:hypothetical protein
VVTDAQHTSDRHKLPWASEVLQHKLPACMMQVASWMTIINPCYTAFGQKLTGMQR